MNFTNRITVSSADGSSTLRIAGTDEHFHSVHGALNESMHIYIEAGMRVLKNRESVNILEVGFGTGLNALLTLIYQENRTIRYHGIEAYPLREEEVKSLNYNTMLMDDQWEEYFFKMHAVDAVDEVEIAPGFFFRKSLRKLEEMMLSENQYDLVYFDAFSPDLQPELWSEEIFQRIYNAMTKDSVLITYCAKGRVKRAMKATGFTVEGLPGPVGKREISRAVKK
jgi:tRNA U34 5-methylaminomethyl-2-thiouridine-forming methyltransferase MnmC